MTAMKYRSTYKWCEAEYTLPQIATRELIDHEGGIAECAYSSSQNVAAAFGRLIDRLVEDGKLDPTAALEIIGAWGYEPVK